MKNKINRCLLILCVSTMLTSVGRGERPNIIMFLIDDQNPSSIAAFGGNTYTPNIDRMAKEGMKFTRAYVSSSVCTPSRYSFLTGRLPVTRIANFTTMRLAAKRTRGFPVLMSHWNATR